MSKWLPTGKLKDGTLLFGPLSKEGTDIKRQIKISVGGKDYWVGYSGKDLSDAQKVEIQAWAEKKVSGK